MKKFIQLLLLIGLLPALSFHAALPEESGICFAMYTVQAIRSN